MNVIVAPHPTPPHPTCNCVWTGTSSSFLLSCRHRHCFFIISYWWGGVGCGNNVHVPVHTQAQQPHHHSCCPADTGTALSWSLTGGVGWGATITFMFLCTHRHSNLIIFLAVLQTQALLFHDHSRSFMITYRWGGVGCHNNVHVPVHTQAQQPHHLCCCPAGTGTALSWQEHERYCRTPPHPTPPVSDHERAVPVSAGQQERWWGCFACVCTGTWALLSHPTPQGWSGMVSFRKWRSGCVPKMKVSNDCVW